MKNVIIYGKEDCFYCKEAKTLSDTNGVSYDWKDVTVGDTKQELLSMVPNAKTVPQIFVNGVHVGGFDEYEKYSAVNLITYGELK